MCVFGGNRISVNESGILVAGGDTDNTVIIESFEIMSLDFGTMKEKRIRQVELSGYLRGLDIFVLLQMGIL